MNDKSLTIKETKVIFNPEKDTTKAEKAAKKLMDIVKQQGWAVKVGQGEHLMYEAWQTVGKYYNVTVATGEANPVEIGGVQGFKAKAWAVDNRTGVRVGEAEAYCMKDEFNWKAKPLFQLASMAQTRAGSKALRQIFGFVVALAGYNPCPAEEMIVDEKKPIEKEQTYSNPITNNQRMKIMAMLGRKGKSVIDLHSYIERAFNKKSIKELTITEASRVIEKLDSFPDQILTDKKKPSNEPEVNIDEIDEAIEKSMGKSSTA